MLSPPPVAGPVLVGYSGGMDSTVLLHLLAADSATRARGLRAIHVHHGLQAQADDWADHCRATCAALDLPLTIARVTVDRNSGQGLEAAARQVRYQAFEAALGKGGILALAHHRDDQAETFLLRALRGSGVEGLRAMPAWRRIGRGWLWRPLLEHPQAQLLDYARAHRLHWADDPSNAAGDHDRNHLRLHVLPLLRQRWPHAAAALARSATLAGEAASLLAGEDQAGLSEVSTADPQVIGADALLRHPRERRARILRAWLALLDLPPLPAQGVAHLESDLLSARADATPAFAWSGARIRRWRNLLHASAEDSALPSNYRVGWDGLEPLHLPTGDLLRLERIASASDPGEEVWQMQVHARQGGERIVLPGRTHSHALKHVLQELDIAPWVRERLPLLSAKDGSLLAAADVALSSSFKQQLGHAGLRLTWQRQAVSG
ncbi:tRNA lysidine(34) synthetase TilS [Luteimonas sp. A277]